MTEHDYTSVRQLQTVGPRPSEALVRRILKNGDATFVPLVELATNLELLDEEEPALFAPLHALRLLGEMPKPGMIRPLLSKFPIDIYGDWDDMASSWGHEVPTIIGRLGALAIEPLWQMFDDETLTPESRGVAVLSLACVAVFDPTQRETLVATLRDRFATAEDMMQRTHLVIGLANFAVPEMYAEIMALYRENKINKELLPARNARQLLLGKGEEALQWTNYTLDERYEKLGPE